MSERRGGTAPFKQARDVFGQVPLDELDVLSASEDIALDEETSSVLAVEDTSAEMQGFDDDRGLNADPDGDFADEHTEEGEPLELLGGTSPTPLRRARPDIRFEPRRSGDGTVSFHVRLPSGAGFSDNDETASGDVADLLRARVEAIARIGDVLARRQRSFLEALVRGASFDEADARLAVVTQDEVWREAGLDKDTVARLVNTAYADVGGPGTRSFLLAKLMARSRTLGVHPDALRSHVRRLGPTVGTTAALVDALIHDGVIERPSDKKGLRSLREHVRQVCARAGVSLEYGVDDSGAEAGV